MTIANDLIFISLRNSGVNGVGQTPMADDVNDSFKILNAWINELNLERRVEVNSITLPPFPNLTTDVPFWSPYEHVLLTSMAVRLRQIYALPAVELDVQLAISALKAFNAINLQQISAPTIAADDGTGYGILYLALRAAGRVNDQQGVLQSSQDITDAHSLMNEMLDEWQRDRTVRVIPGMLPVITDLSAPVALDTGVRNAIVLNLAVRLRDAFGAEVSKTLADRAERAFQLIQAINQQQSAPLHPGAPATSQQVVFLALRMAGRITDNQSVADGSKDVADAFSQLVMMLAQWQRRRWLVWNEQEVAAISTGRSDYTIGPGADFNVSRPDKINAAWVRMQPFGGPNAVDLPLDIITAKEDWARVTIKDLKSLPTTVFYDSAFPVGRVLFWPVPPSGQYEMHIVVKTALPVPTSITDPLALPPEYFEAVVNNLACRIIIANGGQISPFLVAQASASLATIKMANMQIGLLYMPSFGGRGTDVSNWIGGGVSTPHPFILNRDVLNGEAIL